MRNTPNYQGVFLRGLGSQSFSQINGSLNGVTTTIHSSGILGTIQGDSIRNISGNVSGGSIEEDSASTSGAIYISGRFPGAGSGWSDYGWGFDASRNVPTSNENRPINVSVRYLIKAK